MLAEELGTLVERGAPAELFDNPIPFYRSTPHGRLHGNIRCPRLEGVTDSVWKRPLAVRRSCYCAYLALGVEPDAMIAYTDGKSLQEAQSRVGELLEDSSSLAERLVKSWLLREELETFAEDLHQVDWRHEWCQDLRKRVGEHVDLLEGPLRNETGRARAGRVLVAEGLRQNREEGCFTAEDEKVLGSRQQRHDLREYLLHLYTEGIRSNLDVEELVEQLATAIRSNQPEQLTTTMLEFPATTSPRPGQTVREWVEEVWQEHASTVAASTVRHLDTRVEELLSGEGRVLLGLSANVLRSPDLAETIATYRFAEVDGVVLLEMPEGAARGLEEGRARWNQRAVIGRAQLEAEDGPEVLEVLVGLYQPGGGTFGRLAAALEAARAVLSPTT